MDYQLEIKQIVDYPRCRMYREFIRRIMEDRSIRTNGSSYLFYFVILCSYVNFRSSYRRLDGITYLVEPGQWICTAAELSEWFRTRFQHQAISILDTLKKQRRELSEKRKALYAEYRKAQAEMRQAVAVKANIDHLLGHTDGRENKAQER